MNERMNGLLIVIGILLNQSIAQIILINQWSKYATIDQSMDQ